MWIAIVYLILQINTTTFLKSHNKNIAIVKITLQQPQKTRIWRLTLDKFKKMMSVTLAGCMYASALMGSAGAANVQTGTTPAPVAAPQNVRSTVTPSTTVKLNTNSSNQIVPWSIYSGYGYRKIHVINTLQKQNDCKNHKIFPTGELVCARCTFPAGGKLPFYGADGHPLSAGAYYLDISTNGTYPLNGTCN